MKKFFFYVAVFFMTVLLCSCSEELASDPKSGTLRIVGIGATGKEILSPGEVIKFAEYDVYETMLGFGALGEKAGYEKIEYYNFFPEMTLDTDNQGFKNRTYTTFSDYSSLTEKLKKDTQVGDFTIVIVSSHGSYSSDRVECTDTSAYENASIYTVKKTGFSYSREDITMKAFDNDLNSLKGTVVALVQVCYSGSVIIGDTVIANTDVYPDASVLKNLFDFSSQNISNHVFYICSSPYYSKSVGERNGKHSYFFKAVQKGIGMDTDTFEMKSVIPASEGGLLTLTGLTKYVLKHGGVYNGTGDLEDVEQFPVVSGGSQDLIIFNFN